MIEASSVIGPSAPPGTSNGVHSRSWASHSVQFYEDEEFLCREVANFLGAGLEAAEPVFVVATERHARGILAQLESSGFDVASARGTGQLTVLDASDMLSRFMVGGVPDRQRFAELLGGLFATTRERTGAQRVRVFGEMVELLLRQGNPEGAILLEELWNELGRLHPITLLCAYLMGSFYKEAHAGHLQRICGAHGLVAPTENYSKDAPEDVRLREVALLQQRARALETEIEHRKEVQQRLREALAERRRTEDALRATQQELRQQNEELARTVRFSEMFVGILGHDLRNPLSAITTAASLLTRRAESEKVATPAVRILKSATRMARMIDQLLDFTCIRLGKGLPLESKRIDLRDVCRLAIDELEAATQAPRVRLEALGDLVGVWDGDRLAQLASNLLGNALAHGKPEVPVTLRVDGTDEHAVVLEVHNAGAIPADVLPVIFNPLKSCGDTKQERSSGLGLGLFISREIALAHSGSIDVTSSEEAGTRFTARLPRDSHHSGPAFSEAQENAPGDAEDRTHHR